LPIEQVEGLFSPFSIDHGISLLGVFNDCLLEVIGCGSSVDMGLLILCYKLTLIEKAKASNIIVVGRSDTDEGRTLKESHTYEKHPTKMQQASHNQTTNKILSHFYQLI
jgi:hypothetical protein